MSKKHHKELEKELETLKTELHEMKNKYLHLLADQENTRKRIQKDKEGMIRIAEESAIAEFIPLIDSFETALKFADSASDEVKNWALGFKMMLNQFLDVLHGFGIVSYHSKGNLFDPLYHEAVETYETEEHQNGVILEEFAKGYKSQNRTLRPARVKVAKKPAPVIQEPPKEEIPEETSSPIDTPATEEEAVEQASTNNPLEDLEEKK